jgi:hypothetical protein
MLKVKRVTDGADPVRAVRNIRGEEIPFMLRPWDAEIAREIRKRHVKGFEWVTGDDGRRKKAEIIDDEAHFEGMLDYIVAGFEGIGDEAGNPWPSDLAHKKKVIQLAVERGEQPIWEWILETAKALAFVGAEEALRTVEEQEKN